MFRSMTGFGRQVCRLGKGSVAIEVRTLNGKQLDITFKLPEQYRSMEHELRNAASEVLIRGRVDVIITKTTGEENVLHINERIADIYYKQLRTIYKKWKKKDKDIAAPDYLGIVMKMPALTDTASIPVEEKWEKIESSFRKALEQVDNYRLKEGAILYKDIKTRVIAIEKFREQIPPYEMRRVERIRERLHRDMKNIGESGSPRLPLQVWGGIMDNNRFEQEMIYYIEKMDITEEMLRLKTNCEFFLQTMADEENQGRKLGFIAQELGREINTLGAKANDPDIQKIIVLMKDELEKIKEQLSNVL